MQDDRFTIEANRWYGWQMLPGYVAEPGLYRPYASPALIKEVKPKGSGKKILWIQLGYVIYPTGGGPVGGDLRVLKRSVSWLFADMMDYKSDRSVLISQISFEWMAQFRPKSLYHKPPSPAQQPITDCLNEMFRQQGR